MLGDWSRLFAVKKFPLEPLVRLRAHAVDERSDALRERQVLVETELSARAVAEQRERDHDAARREIDEAELERVAEGAASVADLQWLTQYRARAELVAANLRQQSMAVQRRLDAAERERQLAEQALAEARAEQRVIEQEKSKFADRLRAKQEADAEEEALEVWGARRLAHPRSE
jgi:hypothetical protein